jgi:hypothetical protein
MPSTNGYASPFQTQEWEYPEAHEWEGTTEWEASPEWEGANEWEGTHEGSTEWEGSPEWEGTHEGSMEWEAAHEWETAHEGSREWEGSMEADPFLPFLAPLAAKALPVIARAAVPYVRRLLPVARRAIGTAVQSVLAPPPARPAYRTIGPRPTGVAAGSGRQTALRLVRRLHGLIQRGEAEAAEAEAAFFGNADGELEWEVGQHPAAHEAALTEVLAAEAAHTASEAEAQALLGAALPITIRIIAGPRALRRVTPALVQANAGLVRGLRGSGPRGPQLLRTVPTIQRRTLASLKAMYRSGRPIRPTMVAPLMAAHAAKVLATPRICGPALVRNTVIRQRAVPPRAARYST